MEARRPGSRAPESVLWGIAQSSHCQGSRVYIGCRPVSGASRPVPSGSVGARQENGCRTMRGFAPRPQHSAAAGSGPTAVAPGSTAGRHRVLTAANVRMHVGEVRRPSANAFAVAKGTLFTPLPLADGTRPDPLARISVAVKARLVASTFAPLAGGTAPPAPAPERR